MSVYGSDLYKCVRLVVAVWIQFKQLRPGAEGVVNIERDFAMLAAREPKQP
jgi:hypothetical protein